MQRLIKTMPEDENHKEWNKTLIPKGSNIKEVVTSLITDFCNIEQYVIKESGDIAHRTTPHDLEFTPQDTILQMLVSIRDLYSGSIFYFNSSDVFVFECA